jgi:hypothetical protein
MCVENPLKSLISEMVTSELEEITARTGPRTGAFYFPPEAVEQIVTIALKTKEEMDSGILPKDETRKVKVTIPSPISGDSYVFPVWLYWDSRERASAWLLPYKGGGKGKVGINLAQVENPAHLRSIIRHELVHGFDPQLFSTLNKTSANPKRKAYWKSAHEKKAILHQMLLDMANAAQRIAERVDQGYSPELSLAKTWLAKPELLIRHVGKIRPGFEDIILLYKTDKYIQGQEWLRQLYKGAFDITRSYLEPAVEKRQKQLASQKNI